MQAEMVKLTKIYRHYEEAQPLCRGQPDPHRHLKEHPRKQDKVFIDRDARLRGH